ncbi:unnamed protein product [Arabis nemorensis]|uniref:Uncharacterized protein n=1 Tax=Arabis nemorensis TaxID=586526 RepID=A0A565CGU2_9BRAS|nr:unnamed protein product [Arabis nemorensis]
MEVGSADLPDVRSALGSPLAKSIYSIDGNGRFLERNGDAAAFPLSYSASTFTSSCSFAFDTNDHRSRSSFGTSSMGINIESIILIEIWKSGLGLFAFVSVCH